MLRDSVVDVFAKAIGTQKGFFAEVKNPTRAQRNHNPGNLRGWDLKVFPVDKNGFTIFPDDKEGWRALKTQVSLNFARGLSIREFFEGKPGIYYGYAPKIEGDNPEKYTKSVMKALKEAFPEVPWDTKTPIERLILPYITQ